MKIISPHNCNVFILFIISIDFIEQKWNSLKYLLYLCYKILICKNLNLKYLTIEKKLY